MTLLKGSMSLAKSAASNANLTRGAEIVQVDMPSSRFKPKGLSLVDSEIYHRQQLLRKNLLLLVPSSP